MMHIYRFLTQCFLLQVLAATLISVAMLFAMHAINGYWHLFMLWNLLLAWIPYAMSVWVVWLYRHPPQRKCLVLAPALLWLLFFPNAPYPVTDFVHMRFDPRPVWYDVAIIAAFAWTGLLLALVSLKLMQSVVREMVHPLAGWLLVGSTLLLAGFGIYLGRVLRWNSWDVLVHPRAVAYRLPYGLADPFSHRRAIGTTGLFAMFLLMCYVSFASRPRVGSK